MSDATSTNSARNRRWLILGVIGLAQLMVIAGIFTCGAVVGGTLLRRGPLYRKGTQSPADDRITTAQPEARWERAR